jgi:hypothetical protein
MNNKSAVELWNSTAQILQPDCAQITHLGCAALATDVPTYALAEGIGVPCSDHNMKIVRFLRAWADGIEAAPERETQRRRNEEQTKSMNRDLKNWSAGDSDGK